MIRRIPGIGHALGDGLKQELQRHYRVPHVRCVVRTRLMCQAGRCRSSGAARDNVVAWLCEWAPLWVVVHVCRLLRDDYRKSRDFYDSGYASEDSEDENYR